MKLIEILNSKLAESRTTTQNLTWSYDSTIDQYKAKFELDERDYELVISHYDFSQFDEFRDSPELQDIQDVYLVDFTGKDANSGPSYKATGDRSLAHALSVISIVSNGVIDKIRAIGKYDVVAFTAKDQDDSFSSRVKLYHRLCNVLKKELSLIYSHETFHKFELFLLSHVNVARDLARAIVQLITQ